MSSEATSDVYVQVIEDVINKVRQEFAGNEGPGETALKQLQGACFWKQHWSYWRHPEYNAIRFFMSAVFGVIFGSIFWGQGQKMVWHETAIPFKKVIQQFEDWLTKHQVWANKSGGHLNKGAFITCGNWDIKSKIPEQYKVAGMKLPPYFMEWINLKDIYLNFYKRKCCCDDKSLHSRFQRW